MKKDNSNSAFVNTIVGEGACLVGELTLDGLLRIDGDFSGSIKTSGRVLVGKTGRAECSISADETVVIGGAVKGNIYSAGKVVILSSGMVIGNIQAKTLVTEEGVLLHGQCLIRADEEKGSRPVVMGSTYSLDWQQEEDQED